VASLACIYILLIGKEFAASVLPRVRSYPSCNSPCVLPRGTRTIVTGSDATSHLLPAILSRRSRAFAPPRRSTSQCRYWFDLAAAYQVTGDTAGQRTALDRALQAEPPPPTWRGKLRTSSSSMATRATPTTPCANSTSSSRTTHPRLPRIARFLARSSGYGRAAPRRGTGSSRFPARLSRFADEQAGDRRRYQDLGPPRSAAQKFPNRYLYDFVHYLIGVNRPDAAMSAWQQTADVLGLSATAHGDNLVVNGDFSLDVLNGGFDWIYVNRIGVKPCSIQATFTRASDRFRSPSKALGSKTPEFPNSFRTRRNHLRLLRLLQVGDFEAQAVRRSFCATPTPEPPVCQRVAQRRDFWKEVHSKVTTRTPQPCCFLRSSAFRPVRRFAEALA